MTAAAPFDAIVIGAGAAGLMCAARRGPARRARAADRARDEARREDPHLRRRPLQLHQPARAAGDLPVGQPALLPLGAGALHAARLHRPGRAPRHRLPREAQGPAVLRRLDASRSSRCCCAECAAGACALAMPCRVRRGRGATATRLPRSTPTRGSAAARGAGHRHRRPVDPEDRRERFRLSRRAPVRPARRRAAAGAGAADLRRRRWQPFAALAGRRRCAVASRCNGAQRSRGPAVHASRAVGPGDPADLELLASRRTDRSSTCCPDVDAAALLARRAGARTQRRQTLANVLAALLPQPFRRALVRRRPDGQRRSPMRRDKALRALAASPAALAAACQRHRGLPQGRGHPRRRRHRRACRRRR